MHFGASIHLFQWECVSRWEFDGTLFWMSQDHITSWSLCLYSLSDTSWVLVAEEHDYFKLGELSTWGKGGE